MANFIDGRRFKSISEKLIHVPSSGTAKVGLKGPLDAGGVAFEVRAEPPGVCEVVPGTLQAGIRFFTLKGLRPGEATLSARSAGGALQDFVKIHVHLPRIRQLPDFGALNAGYPGDEETSDAFRERIGGAVNNPQLLNTCTMRLSAAFNAAGHPIPQGRADLATRKGKDGKAYAIRVAEFKKYLLRTYGLPDIVRTPAAKGQGVPTTDFASLAGVMCFDVQFNDATGHLTLWNGYQVVHGDYFARAYKVSLWMAG